MLKIIVIIVLAAIFSAHIQAQCIITTTVFPSSTYYGLIPDTITNLPIATAGTPYATDLQLHMKPDTATTFGTFTIQQIKLDSIVGLPSGFSVSSNPSSGIVAGGAYGCYYLSGTPTTMQATQGPNNDGIYPITIYYTATVNVFFVPTDFPSTTTGYKIKITNGVSTLIDASTKDNEFNIFPIPTNDELSLKLYTAINKTATVEILNLQGQVVKQMQSSLQVGNNNLSINVSELPSSVYYVVVNTTDTKYRKKVIVQHN